jgi:hypothetical protein
MTQLIRSIMIIFVIFQFYNCAELLNGKDDSKDKDNLTALGLAFLVGAGSCPSTEISAQPTNGTAYDFTKCSGSVASALGSAGFSGSNVSLVSGIAGTSATSTIITNASRLSSTGGEKKASIEITYVLSASDSTLDVIMPSSTSFTGPTFQISTTDIKKKNPSGVVSALNTAGTWSSSLGTEKILCLEVHQENGAHLFGWTGSCATVNRGSYTFEDEDSVSGFDFSGDKIAVKINKATIKSMKIYSANIGTAGNILF